MSWLKKGPDLKLSDLKVPDFLFDLYYDLKERRLLPLVVLLLVAIVAVPIALGQASSNSDEPEEAVEAPTAGASGASPGALVVAKSAPGLRDYRRRLEHGQAVDPFKQQQAASASGSSEASSGAASEGGETGTGIEESPVPFEASGGSGTEYPSGGGGASTDQGDAKYASNTVDVRIVSMPSGDQSSAKPKAEVRRNLPELTMLPSRETPAATFMGTSADGEKALMLVSSDVQSIFGDGQCVVGSKACQLLALEKGLPETFVYGPQGRTYRIEVLKIERIMSSKLRRAPLGNPKQGQGKQKQDSGNAPESKPEAESPAAG